MWLIDISSYARLYYNIYMYLISKVLLVCCLIGECVGHHDGWW